MILYALKQGYHENILGRYELKKMFLSSTGEVEGSLERSAYLTKKSINYQKQAALKKMRNNRNYQEIEKKNGKIKR